MRATVEHLRGKDGHENHEWPAHEAEQREKQKDAANGTRRYNVSVSLLELLDHADALVQWGIRLDAHHEQRRDNRDIADTVDEEAPAFVRGGDDDAGERRA